VDHMILWKYAASFARRQEPALSAVFAVSAMMAVIAGLASSSAGASRVPVGTHTRTHGLARAAHALSVNDTGHLRSGGESGSTIIEEGRVTGTLHGSVRASLALGTTTVRVGFTIYLHGGTITGHAVAALNPGKGEYASFGGTLTVSHGGGRYAHAAGTGRVSGTLNRYTYAAVVQVVGQLHY
jgi:hypothetical protein